LEGEPRSKRNVRAPEDFHEVEPTTVNRPFPAFAALLVLMTLAVIAISATSRSTSVIPTPRRTHALSKSRVAGRCNFVWIVPAAASPLPSRDQNPERKVTDKRLHSAVIAVADSVPQTTGICDPMDGRSHYDPVYDAVVYGPQVIATRQFSASTAAIEADEMLMIFQQLGPSRRSAEPTQLAAGIESVLRTLWLRASSASAAARIWIAYHIRRLTDQLPVLSNVHGIETSQLAWNDYDTLINRATSGGEKSRRPGPALRYTDVRFGDWLRHSAAPQFSTRNSLLTSPAGLLVP
jgi:hypothetical protein